ncbi:MAG: rpfC 5 [Acidobacteria bacterium]|nr:rpfC 5 [Acidobacteriota bacterium]
MGAADVNPDIGHLRRCIGDVVALSTLSAVWAGAARPRIADSLAQVLCETLGADLVYVGLRGTAGAAVCEAASRRNQTHDQIGEAIRADLAGWLRQPGAAATVPQLSQPSLTHVVTPIGISAEHGVIVTVASHAGFPSETHRLLLNVAANQATLALLTDSARDEQRIADILQRVGTSIAGDLDPERVVQTVTDEATGLTGANFGAFFYNVVNRAGESYMLYTLAGAPREAFSRFPMPRNTGIFAPTFAGAGVVRLDDVIADPRFGHNPPYHGMPAGHLPVRSYLAVPVLSRTGKVHGGLFLGHRDVGVFTERHERLVVGLAAWAALALDNSNLYADAQRANLAKDQFLATLSHELRTPLNAIVGWLSMLRRPEVMSPAGMPKAWAAIDRNSEALTGLIEDLLDVSRIATGKLRLAEAEVDINEVFRDSARTMEPKFDAKRVRLTTDIGAEPYRVRGDAARLRQVAVNLLANAVRFTASGGQVDVRVACEGASIIATVIDTGIGIHPDFLPHVFEQFRQGDSDTTMGLGLGLAIVKNLVELHGGSVAAESDGIGRGSRFTVTLPRASADSGTANPAS